MELSNLRSLKDKLWTDYLINSIEAYNGFMNVYDNAKKKIEEIFKQAKKEQPKWRAVIDLYNRRFDVPFTVILDNQVDVILNESAPALKFDHTGQGIPEKELWDLLSMGEKRALYLLNIIFEVQGRIESNEGTLFVIDDIADSFDYKNKYAILEYLYDMSRVDNYYQIILTHNFDFYRTIVNRFEIANNKYFVEKTKTEMVLVADKYHKSPFSVWKKQLASNDEMFVASIPFVRTLADYRGLEEDYDVLTKILHFKPDTNSITVGDVENIFKNALDKIDVLKNKGKKVKELIYELADKICSDKKEVIELERKIVLSIAIRLKMEEFLVEKINDDAYWKSITNNQTLKLIKRYKKDLIDKDANEKHIITVNQVSLMTPENIHINSFMYEPILDMSNDHLKRLYSDVCSLK